MLLLIGKSIALIAWRVLLMFAVPICHSLSFCGLLLVRVVYSLVCSLPHQETLTALFIFERHHARARLVYLCVLDVTGRTANWIAKSS